MPDTPVGITHRSDACLALTMFSSVVELNNRPNPSILSDSCFLTIRTLQGLLAVNLFDRVILFNGFDQILSFDTQPHGNRSRHKNRRVNTKPDTDR